MLRLCRSATPRTPPRVPNFGYLPPRHEIAERLRLLLYKDGICDMAQTAQELGVDESDLRRSVDERAPSPAIDVLCAVATKFGVDPTFLMTGRYDRETHWVSLEGGRPAAMILLRRLASDGDRRLPIPRLQDWRDHGPVS